MFKTFDEWLSSPDGYAEDVKFLKLGKPPETKVFPELFGQEATSQNVWVWRQAREGRAVTEATELLAKSGAFQKSPSES